MPEYISPPLVTEPADLADEAFAYLEAQVEGWLPAPGNLETWLIESLAQLAGELMDVASAVPTSIFRYYGATILNLPALEAVPATTTTTWTVRDALGYTILAGTVVGIPASGDTLLGFEVAQDTPIPAGQTTATGVVIVAQDAGADGNGLSGAAEIVDALDWVVSVRWKRQPPAAWMRKPTKPIWTACASFCSCLRRVRFSPTTLRCWRARWPASRARPRLTSTTNPPANPTCRAA